MSPGEYSDAMMSGIRRVSSSRCESARGSRSRPLIRIIRSCNPELLVHPERRLRMVSPVMILDRDARDGMGIIRARPTPSRMLSATDALDNRCSRQQMLSTTDAHDKSRASPLLSSPLSDSVRRRKPTHRHHPATAISGGMLSPPSPARAAPVSGGGGGGDGGGRVPIRC